jgi:DNA-binding Lrp family transcriptional regulator
MKDVELKLISELMKNSRRSDRELAKTLGISQPTVTRIRTRLEKERYIKEYTMLPDFSKLGFKIMALVFVRYSKELTQEQYDKFRKAAKEYERENPRAVLMAVRGMGMGYDRVFLSFHENYSSYVETVEMLKTQLPFGAVAHVESFLVSLTDEQHYQPCTFAAIAKYLPKMKGKIRKSGR